MMKIILKSEKSSIFEPKPEKIKPMIYIESKRKKLETILRSTQMP